MKTFSHYLIAIGLVVLAKELGDLFNLVLPFLDWKLIFAFWGGALFIIMMDKLNK